MKIITILSFLIIVFTVISCQPDQPQAQIESTSTIDTTHIQNIVTMSKAAKPNPALSPLKALIGEWKTVGKHPMLPGVILNGQTSFEWLEKGAFLMMRNHIDHKDFPDGIAIIGSDDSAEAYSMIYFDEREVSRNYTTTLKDNIWIWSRNDPEFSQRFTGRISDDGNTIVSHGEMSKNGKPWEKDLELTYTRIE